MNGRGTLAGLVLAIASLAAVPAGAVVVASQNFNGIADVGHVIETTLDGTILTSAATTHNGSSGLGYATRWITDFDIKAGPSIDGSDIDRIGVNIDDGFLAPDVSAAGVPVGAGEHNFELNDSDGRLQLEFAPVDMSGYENRRISFDLWSTLVDYSVGEGYVYQVTTLFAAGCLGPIEPNFCGLKGHLDNGLANWLHIDIDLDSRIASSENNNPGFTYDDTQVRLNIAWWATQDDQSLFIDNVLFTGDPLPDITDPPDCIGGPPCDDPTDNPGDRIDVSEPAPLLLFGAILGCLAFRRRRGAAAAATSRG